jgi:hypothetical protein
MPSTIPSLKSHTERTAVAWQSYAYSSHILRSLCKPYGPLTVIKDRHDGRALLSQPVCQRHLSYLCSAYWGWGSIGGVI